MAEVRVCREEEGRERNLAKDTDPKSGTPERGRKKRGHKRVSTNPQQNMTFQNVTLSVSAKVSHKKGVHAHLLTAREREHWFLQHLRQFWVHIFGRQ